MTFPPTAPRFQATTIPWHIPDRKISENRSQVNGTLLCRFPFRVGTGAAVASRIAGAVTGSFSLLPFLYAPMAYEYSSQKTILSKDFLGLGLGASSGYPNGIRSWTNKFLGKFMTWLASFGDMAPTQQVPRP